MNQKIELILKKIVLFFGVLAIATPLIYSFSSMYHSMFLRGIAFEASVVVMASAWILLMIGSKKYYPDFSHPVVKGIGVLAIATLVSLPFAEGLMLSFFSNHIRMVGVFAMLCFWGFALILHSVINEKKDWRLLLIAAIEVALLVTIYGIFEWATGPGGYRMYSTLGNPLFFAQYLLPATFISLMLALSESHRTKRYAYFAASAFFALSMLGTASRGSALGFGVAAIVVAILAIQAFVKSSTIRKRAIAGIVALVLIGFSGFYFLSQTEQGRGIAENAPLIVKRAALASYDDRLQLWSLAIDGIKEKPIFGHGFEQYLNVFNKHVEPGGKNFELNEFMFDRPHNFYLEWTLSTGLVGLLGLVAFYVYLVKYLFKLWKEDESTHGYIVGFSGLMVAHAVSTTFLFTLFAESMAVFLAVGFMMSLRRNQKDDDGFHVSPIAIGFVSSAAVMFIIFVFLLPLRSGLLAERAFRAVRQDGSQPAFQRAVKDLQSALGTHTWINEKLRIRTADLMRPIAERIGFRSPELKELTRFLAAELEESAFKNPNEYEVALTASFVYRMGAVYYPGYVERALFHAHNARRLSEGNPDPYEELGEVALLIGNVEEAEAWFLEALKRSRPHVDSGRVEYRLAAISAYKDDVAGMYDFLALAEEHRFAIYHDSRLVETLGDLSVNNPGFARATLPYAEGVFEKFPGQPYVFAAAVKMYGSVGDEEKYNAALARLKELHPDLARALEK